MEALSTFESFIKQNPSTFKGKQEAVLQFILLFSKDFKVANMNLLKSAFSLSSSLITTCGAGPKACQAIVESCIAKIHDKKLGGDLSSLICVICEKVGPNAVLSQVCLFSCTDVDHDHHGEKQNSSSAKCCSIFTLNHRHRLWCNQY